MESCCPSKGRFQRLLKCGGNVPDVGLVLPRYDHAHPGWLQNPPQRGCHSTQRGRETIKSPLHRTRRSELRKQEFAVRCKPEEVLFDECSFEVVSGVR